ncbi:hypothetical protein GCM10011374_21680 [Kocuria dechangensis]|uniref:VOC domain-containing protein n=1 Tax=Kocuria dechangensis TaxID=1176249 RepID=A0A917GVQ5_9MICC|nr:VOC family protein [Kocuria dechangensis]GGG58514.1 hypothetical protein GCM10011374_21680 [Kocuria dechangensis]
MAERNEPWPAGTPCWADLMVTDLGRTQAFYREVLGWSFTEPLPDFGGYCNALVDGQPVAGLSPTPEDMTGHPNVWSVYLATDDIEADADNAIAAGAKLLLPPVKVGPFGSMGMWADPTGAIFGMWQAGEHTGFRVVDEPGAVTWCDLTTPDRETARRFYAEVFGYTYQDIGEGGGEGGVPYALFTVPGGDRPGGGIGGTDPGEENAVAVWSVCFQIVDVDDAVRRVLDAGGSVMEHPFDFQYGRLALVAGPDREAFALMTPGGAM